MDQRLMSEKTEGTVQKHILILCVDRDGDLGTKARIKTPLIGRNANLEAAVSLALKDPEEADANAMFEAVSLYDRLLKEKKAEESFEIATICGSELGGVGADRKLVSELTAILESYSANEVILVTDGYTDEAILPLVESRVPVSSVRRIVVKHSESIEETAQLFGKYLKTLVQNPKYSRVALGLPGALMLIWIILAILQVSVFYYLITILLVVSSFMLIKGFGVDRSTKNFYKWAKEYSPPPLPVQIGNYSTIAGILCIAVSVYSGYSNALQYGTPLPIDTGGWLSALPKLSAFFLQGAAYLVVVGLCTILIGRGVKMYFAHDVRVLRNAVLIGSIAWSSIIINGAADVLISPSTGLQNLIFYIIVGILIAIASVLFMLILHRSYKNFFVESEEKAAEFGQN
jgi:putative membrane protein